jgi:hypothetical protein
MKRLADLAVGLAIISIVVGVISRLSMRPVSGLLGSAFLEFSAVCLLFAIALYTRAK